MRSLRDTLGLTRRDERATANDIQSSRIPAEETANDAKGLSRAELTLEYALTGIRLQAIA